MHTAKLRYSQDNNCTTQILSETPSRVPQSVFELLCLCLICSMPQWRAASANEDRKTTWCFRDINLGCLAVLVGHWYRRSLAAAAGGTESLKAIELNLSGPLVQHVTRCYTDIPWRTWIGCTQIGLQCRGIAVQRIRVFYAFCMPLMWCFHDVERSLQNVQPVPMQGTVGLATSERASRDIYQYISSTCCPKFTVGHCNFGRVVPIRVHSFEPSVLSLPDGALRAICDVPE